MLRFTRHYKDIIQERLMVFDIVLLQTYWNTYLPKIVIIELDLTKLLHNKMVLFLTHSI